MILRAIFILVWLSAPLFAMQQNIFKNVLTIGNQKLIVFSNWSLKSTSSRIDRIIVAIQGNKRDASSRINAVRRAAKSVGANSTTLIISPQFKISDDKPRKDELYWKNSGWKQGDNSLDESNLSSFAALDHVIGRIVDTNNFPNLIMVFITGHSAGGQFTQRYALTSGIAENFPALRFSYLVLNPSSYTYLNKFRPSMDLEEPWIELGKGAEKNFNHYKYGLSKRNPYARALNQRQLRTQYLQRDVYYVLGQADNDPHHDELDFSPAAKVQGLHRLSRGRNYFAHLSAYYPSNNHGKIEVPLVGHDAEKMYAADEVKEILFKKSALQIHSRQ